MQTAQIAFLFIKFINHQHQRVSLSFTKKMKYKFLFILIFIASFGKSQEVDSLIPMDIVKMSLDELLQVKVKVSSTIPTDVFNSPSTVSVITSEYFDQYNFTTVAEAVQQVAGVEILQTVIDKNVPTLRGILQNLYANKVLIMINNVPVWHPTYGNSTIDRIGINEVDRIEILKGPASVLYGTNAYSGVINIVLHDSQSDSFHARIDAGYPNLGAASFSFGTQKGDFGWRISGSSSLDLRKPYLINGWPDTLFVGDAYLFDDDTSFYYTEELRKKAFNAELHYKGHSVYTNNFINSYTTPGVNSSFQSGANRTVNDYGSLLTYRYNSNLSEKIIFNSKIYFDYHYRNQLQTQADLYAARFSSYRVGGSCNVNYHINEKLSAEFGGELFDGHNIAHQIIAVTPDTVIRDNITNTTDIVEGSVFSQLSFSYKKLRVLGGARYTLNNNYGGDLSPRISGLLALNEHNKFKLVYGQSYRNPNLLELYFDHWSVAGNPELKPERCASAELIYLKRYKNFFGQVNFYHSLYSNLILRVPAGAQSSAAYVYGNASQFEGFGVETELKYHNPEVLNFYVNYNFMDGNSKGIESNFKYVPQHTVSAGIYKPIKKFFVSSNAYYYSEVEGPWETIGGQFMINANLGCKQKVKNKFITTHTLSAKNISNSDMLIPEYIRRKANVNTLATTGYGMQIIYSLKVEF